MKRWKKEGSSLDNKKSGILLSLDEQGVIEDIMHTPESLTFKKGTPIITYVDDTAKETFYDLFEHARKHRFSFGTLLPLAGGEQDMRVTVAIVRHAGDFLFIGHFQDFETMKSLEETISLNNKQINRLRDSMKQNASPDAAAFEEISKLNSELITTRRALEQKNRSLESLNKRLEAAQRTDPLTNVPNRRAFFLDYENVTLEEPIRLVFTDFNNFKLVNDSLGHQAGDEALIHFTEEIRAILKEKDRVYRFGGDEFLIVIHADNDQFLKQLPEVGESLKEIHPSLSLAEGSAGLDAGETLSADRLRKVLAKADKNMYRSKRSYKKSPE